MFLCKGKMALDSKIIYTRLCGLWSINPESRESVSKLSFKTHVPPNTLRSWKDGKALPQLRNIEEIAERIHFDVGEIIWLLWGPGVKSVIPQPRTAQDESEHQREGKTRKQGVG
jgi:hypothetical protein